LLLHQDGGHRFERYAKIDILAIADACLYATIVVSCGANAPLVVDKRVVHLTASVADARKTFAIFKALSGIDGQHGSPQLRMQLIKLGLAQSYGTSLDDTRYDSSHRVTFHLHLPDELFHLLGLFLIGTTYHVAFGLGQVV
jgi:hypothetical protein